MYLAEELISPLLTPFILYFNVRLRALDFVDFLRNYTVNVVGKVSALFMNFKSLTRIHLLLTRLGLNLKYNSILVTTALSRCG